MVTVIYACALKQKGVGLNVLPSTKVQCRVEHWLTSKKTQKERHYKEAAYKQVRIYQTWGRLARAYVWRNLGDKLLGGGGGVEEFSTLDSFNRTGFILGCENWDRYDFKALLQLVKNFVLLVCDTRKNKLYGDQDGATPGCSCSCPLTGDLKAPPACVDAWSMA